jgi:hypothetical protein
VVNKNEKEFLVGYLDLIRKTGVCVCSKTLEVDSYELRELKDKEAVRTYFNTINLDGARLGQ